MKRNTFIHKIVALTVIGASTLGVAFTVQQAFAEPGMGQRQGRGRHGAGGKQMMQRMAQELKLTSSQKTKLQSIMKDSRERGRKIRENTELSQEQKRAEMRSNREATKKKMDAVLTPEQRRKMEAMRAQMRSEMRARRQQNGGSSRTGNSPRI